MTDKLAAQFNEILDDFSLATRTAQTVPSSKFHAAMDEWFAAIERLGMFIHAHPEFKQWDVRKQAETR